MKLYIKQKVFSWGDKFRIYDAYGNDYYYVQGEVFTFGKKLHLLDRSGNELAFIRQKIWSFLPQYRILQNGMETARVIREFTLFRPRYSVQGPGWTVHGNYWEHDYEISGPGGVVARVAKRWFSWGDTYEIDIADSADEIMALCVVLVIDAVIAQSNAAASSSSNH